ncbi:MAG: hypothetical protein GXP13_10735 [Gammaproteobacteria bacterium]|nr:hypothetical protein [Gammaproteobacteria bacterium]
MAKKKKIPGKWTGSDKNIRAVQVIFELGLPQSRALRIKAIEQDLSPSDFIRDIVHLPRKKPIRPRLSISLSAEDYQILGKRYQLDPDQKERVREKMKLELLKHLDKQ